MAEEPLRKPTTEHDFTSRRAENGRPLMRSLRRSVGRVGNAGGMEAPCTVSDAASAGFAAFRVVCTISGVSHEGPASVSPRTVLLHDDFWHSAYQVNVETASLAFDSLVVSVFIGCERGWYLMADRSVSELSAEARPPWPVGSFVVVQAGAALFKWEFPPWAGVRLFSGVKDWRCVPFFGTTRAAVFLFGMGKNSRRAAALFPSS